MFWSICCGGAPQPWDLSHVDFFFCLAELLQWYWFKCHVFTTDKNRVVNGLIIQRVEERESLCGSLPHRTVCSPWSWGWCLWERGGRRVWLWPSCIAPSECWPVWSLWTRSWPHLVTGHKRRRLSKYIRAHGLHISELWRLNELIKLLTEHLKNPTEWGDDMQ